MKAQPSCVLHSSRALWKGWPAAVLACALLQGAGTASAADLSGPGALKPVPAELPPPDGKPADMSKPVQVFIMMGQSNMVGLGMPGPETKTGSLAFYCKTEKKYPYLIDATGQWRVRQDVRCAMVTSDKQCDWLQPGFGARDKIGP